MDIEFSTVEKMRITGMQNLDPVSVIFEDFEPRHGKVTIEVFGEAWSHGWAGMGDRDVRTFFCECHNGYLITKLLRGNSSENDWEKVTDALREYAGDQDISVTNEFEALELTPLLTEVYGDAWYYELPEKSTTEYCYLDRIVTAIKEALAKTKKVKAAPPSAKPLES